MSIIHKKSWLLLWLVKSPLVSWLHLTNPFYSEHMGYKFNVDILADLYISLHCVCHNCLCSILQASHIAIKPIWMSNYTYILASWFWLFCTAHRGRCNHLSVCKWWSRRNEMIFLMFPAKVPSMALSPLQLCSHLSLPDFSLVLCGE